MTFISNIFTIFHFDINQYVFLSFYHNHKAHSFTMKVQEKSLSTKLYHLTQTQPQTYHFSTTSQL